MTKLREKGRKSDMLKLDDDLYFSYDYIGEFSSDTTWIHGKRSIKSFEVIFVIEGTIYIEEEKTPYEISANQILILEPGKIHRGFRPSEGKTAFYWFHYKSNMPLPFKTYQGAEYYEIKYALKKLLHIANTLSYPDFSRDAAAFMVYSELTKIGEAESARHPLLGKIMEYIRINIRNSPTVASVARDFGYNPDYISRIFRISTGTTMKSYINNLKMNLARDYLLTTAFPIKQIAQSLSFQDEKSFIKFFVYHEKISPTAFRHRFYNTHMNNE